MGKGGGFLTFSGMVMVMVAQVTSMMTSKEAMSRGMNRFILIVYTSAFSVLVLLPFTVIFRRRDHPAITFPVLSRLFFLSFSGCLTLMSGYAGLEYSSPILGTAILNLIPAFTFILAVICRMESLDWRSSSTQAKSAGALISIAGAFVVTFYKGPAILIPYSSSPHHLLSPHTNWVLGGFLFAVEALMISIWYIAQLSVETKIPVLTSFFLQCFQASILEKYPDELTTVCYYCFFVAIQCAAVSLFLERDPTSWILRPDIGLITVLYNAVVGAAIHTALLSWCLRRAGPLYCSMFKPLTPVLAFVLGVIFHGDVLYLGSLAGAVVITVGFYAVMWGKTNENQGIMDDEVERLEPSSSAAPLLSNKIVEV
ncbi:hypothetical protein NMG60_11008990 [Bertholletia excelsa]